MSPDGSQIAEGAIQIRPEVNAGSSNQSDSSADTTIGQDVRNVFGSQDTSLEGVSADANFGSVALSVNPTIVKGDATNRSGIAKNSAIAVAALAAIPLAAMVLMLRRRRRYGLLRRY